MSDCRVPMAVYRREGGEPVLRLRVEFYGEADPWDYPLALNGRHVRAVYVGGVRYVPAAERDYDCEVWDDR